ncbi:HAMP domain-containing sensor histidine kinase [Raineyella sp. W15-4]|uniref:sensor histidine kinase n=1 Tax=Raineyella sp. W15-4 TaxID=3081651 RepID=UPI0029549FD9|nr:HAMP domain-containing sensor histidine kinase [Raineyella sp. W15-4]WOQ15469.1 HAMP domain-containing sensor histidine kinase [Raineyella sp. W15-4]
MKRTVGRLSTRLLLSHLAVALVGAGVAFGLVRLLAPADFARRTGAAGGLGPTGAGPGTGRGRVLLEAFDAAINQALLVGLLAALVVAALLAWLMVHRLLRPLDRVRTATRALAGGDYDTRVDIPDEVELAALAEDINALGAALQESETRRVRLIGEVAHEMRTPLTVIDGNVEAMIDGIFAATPERLAALSEETRVLRRLAEDLSALSRAEEGRLSLAPAPLDLTVLVGEETDRLRAQYAAAGVTLELMPGPPVPVVADADRIRQVLTNLLGNALRACSAGDRVTVGVTSDGGTAEATVADTGRGIAAGDLPRVFERFYRVPDPASGLRSGTGSGIGLTIARSIARAHGGELTAVSPGPGGGATFRLVLPKA